MSTGLVNTFSASALHWRTKLVSVVVHVGKNRRLIRLMSMSAEHDDASEKGKLTFFMKKSFE